MADNYLLVKGENGYTIKVKLKDLADGTFALATETTASALPTGAATAAKQDAAKTRLDLLGTETTLEAVRGLLAGTLSTEVTGSIPEYSWLDGAAEPTPTEDFAWGYKFNSTTGALTVYGWSGSAWVEVV